MGADHITKDMTMQEILAVFPGAQRTLFSRFTETRRAPSVVRGVRITVPENDGAKPGQRVSPFFDPGLARDRMFTGPSELHR
jgi:hypothetical protein